MSTSVTYIGCRLDTTCTVQPQRTRHIDCKEGRRETLVSVIEGVEAKGFLDPAPAGELRPKAFFAGSTLTGRCLQGCQNALVAAQNGGLPAWVAYPVSEGLQSGR